MPPKTGDALPGATLIEMDADGPAQVQLADRLAGRTVVIFGVPGAYTGTCTTAHMPSFVRNAEALRAKGVDEIICIAVNDPFVLDHWRKETGADTAGITVLGDAEAAFTTGIGMAFSAPPVGLVDRSKRYAMVVKDGTVTMLQEEENPGVCDVSSGDAVLAAL